MKARLAWFAAGAASTATASAAIWFLFSPDHVFEAGDVSEDLYNAFAIHGPLETEWRRVHQSGELDIWSDAENKSLAITEKGRAVQLLTQDDVCCTFEIFEQGEYRATVKYGNFDQRLMSQGVDPHGTVWTYVDMGINGTTDFRYIEGIPKSAQQVIMTQFAGDDGTGTQLAGHDADAGW